MGSKPLNDKTIEGPKFRCSFAKKLGCRLRRPNKVEHIGKVASSETVCGSFACSTSTKDQITLRNAPEERAGFPRFALASTGDHSRGSIFLDAFLNCVGSWLDPGHKPCCSRSHRDATDALYPWSVGVKTRSNKSSVSGGWNPRTPQERLSFSSRPIELTFQSDQTFLCIFPAFSG
ncbi:hypothetical protein M407DRAFT_242710 [Tulasnella calospora MUT 4182]|uniref:Uncharacterized protein n=1 Tax=Tulasnella calospora MUT 4182 TaxID=1051891 RepID=A0A0C3M6K0_9AGAM|nr:hypothetical protein M407DRAFT_242710 [Tulasnella calospora MUT 4182]